MANTLFPLQRRRYPNIASVISVNIIMPLLTQMRHLILCVFQKLSCFLKKMTRLGNSDLPDPLEKEVPGRTETTPSTPLSATLFLFQL